MTNNNQNREIVETSALVKNLDNKILEDPSKKKIASVDTAANITYSLVTGAALDYWSGLPLLGILTSRLYATGINSVTGGPYGWWREKVSKITKTKKDSGRVRKFISEMLAFNTFQVPIYATAVAIGSLISEGRIDMEKVQNGAIHLAEISPFIAPTLGIYTDFSRKLFGVKSAAEGAYRPNE